MAKHKAHEKKKVERRDHDDGGSRDPDFRDKSMSETPQTRGDSVDAAIDEKESPCEPNGDLNASEDEDTGEKSLLLENESTTKRKRNTNDETETDSGNASPMKRQKSSTPPRPSEQHTPKGLDDDLQRSGLSASHQSIGVVQ